MGVYEDTVLHLRDGDCTGPELACSDDLAGERSAVAVPLVEDQDVTVVVGAAAPGDSIDVLWSVYPFDTTCPHEVLGAAVDDWVGSLPRTNTAWLGGDCPPAVGGTMLAWTAPSTDMWTFSTACSAFDSVLYVLGSCEADSVVHGCNDDAVGLQSEVIVPLAAGESVIVVVGAFDARYDSGASTLSIRR